MCIIVYALTSQMAPLASAWSLSPKYRITIRMEDEMMRQGDETKSIRKHVKIKNITATKEEL